MVKSPETITVSGLFVILTNDAAGIIWKMLEKVAKMGFFGFLAATKKQAASLIGEAACFLRKLLWLCLYQSSHGAITEQRENFLLIIYCPDHRFNV